MMLTTLASEFVIEAINACADRISHFHISEPELADFSRPSIDHASIGQALRAVNYDGWLSIEMRRSADPLTSIDDAVSRVSTWYGARDHK